MSANFAHRSGAVFGTRIVLGNVVVTRHEHLHPQPLPPQCTDVVRMLHGTVEVSPGGIRFRRHHQYRQPARPRSHTPRGKVTAFSKSSMRNFRDKLMSLDLEPFIGPSAEAPTGNGFFLSLVYPTEYSLDKDTVHRHRERLSKHLRRNFGNAYLGAVWKLELQDRGAAHLHVIVLFHREMVTSELREWTANLWMETVGCYDLDFRRNGPHVTPLYGSAERLRNYMLKYLPSQFDGELELGRIWGVWEREKGSMPMREAEVIRLETPEEHAELLRRLKSAPDLYPSRTLQRLSEEWKGFGLLGNGQLLRRHLDGLSGIDW